MMDDEQCTRDDDRGTIDAPRKPPKLGGRRERPGHPQQGADDQPRRRNDAQALAASSIAEPETISVSPARKTRNPAASCSLP